jgi:four helix bundle protein
MLALKHTQLEVYKVARQLVQEVYRVVKKLPNFETYGLSNQIRRAANSVKLNIAEGASRKSLVERKRFFEISRGSLVELTSSFETAIDVGYVVDEDLLELKRLVNLCFAMLSRLIQNAK